jgi:hypothetical protein
MIPFDDAHRAVHYPNDRRFRIWIRPSILVLLIVLPLVPSVLAWIQHAFLGLPYIAPTPASLLRRHLSRAHPAARMAFRYGSAGVTSSTSSFCSC